MVVPRSMLAGAVALTLCCATPAAAHVPHTVEQGETLWSIAAASNFTTRALAAANGLSEDAAMEEGSTIQIPSEHEAAVALGGAAAPSVSSPTGPPPAGAYTVQPGDTLTGIAAASGIDAGQLAFMNGLEPDAHVLTGTVLKLPTGAAPAAGTAATAPADPVVPDAAPQPTSGTVDAAQIGQIAADHGVSPDLAAAVAWQESGFNNDLVSPANARGVMQILPGTWSWIEGNIVRRRLDPTSPQENVHAGVMYLGQLIEDAGGDEARAVAGYYQGPSSVASSGLLPETQQYVDNVQALRSRFGG